MMSQDEEVLFILFYFGRILDTGHVVGHIGPEDDGRIVQLF